MVKNRFLNGKLIHQQVWAKPSMKYHARLHPVVAATLISPKKKKKNHIEKVKNFHQKLLYWGKYVQSVKKTNSYCSAAEPW